MTTTFFSRLSTMLLNTYPTSPTISLFPIQSAIHERTFVARHNKSRTLEMLGHTSFSFKGTKMEEPWPRKR